jgi:hypothetical protein
MGGGVKKPYNPILDELVGNWFVEEVALGLTRFRRGLQSSAGHTEDSGSLVNPSEKV